MAQPTPLETSLGPLIMTFHKHAGSGDEELPNITGKGGPDVGELMTMLDHDGDGTVDFKEYITLIESLACMCNCFLEGKMYLLSAFCSVLH
uniref:EF-hand domain-containing protein n=1 Tax=Oncorhynchus tshawytscha TaxID=74940 RepID=A0AAZ3SVG4_ONCTS